MACYKGLESHRLFYSKIKSNVLFIDYIMSYAGLYRFGFLNI